MIRLLNVTLVCYEAKAFQLAELTTGDLIEQIYFGDHIIYNDTRGLSKEEGQKWLWHELASAVKPNSSHVLNIEWDSGLNDPNMWSNEFLKYDYIGAPWPWHPKNERVGNGGFSLLSRRLLEALSNFNYAFPWDDTLCRIHRPKLESLGFKWAPESVAARFSLEHGPMRKSFGYHDCRNWPRILSARDRQRRFEITDPYACAHPSWKEMAAINSRLESGI